jgi:hypothetical protein
MHAKALPKGTRQTGSIFCILSVRRDVLPSKGLMSLILDKGKLIARLGRKAVGRSGFCPAGCLVAERMMYSALDEGEAT